MDSHSQRSGREDSAGEKGQLPHMLQNNQVRIVIFEVQTIPELYYKRFILMHFYLVPAVSLLYLFFCLYCERHLMKFFL